MTYAIESQKVHSRKSTLVTIDPTKRLQVWTVHSGSIYYKDVDYYVIGVKEGTTSYTVAANAGAVTAGKYFFDEDEKRLYVRTTGSVDPSSVFVSATFRLLFSNYPAILPYDLLTGFEIEAEPRIRSTGSVIQEIDPSELFGISLDGKCSVDLINTDGFFDEIYDTLVWENAVIRIYSWFPETIITEKKIVFVGYVSSKSFNSQTVKFGASDFVIQLNNFLSTGELSASDGVLSDGDIGKQKPRIYGRVAGKRLIGVDKTLDGFTGTGTLAAAVGATTITGSGTSFLDEISPGDEIIVNDGLDDYEYKVDTVNSNTEILISDELEINLGAKTFLIKPEFPWRKKNRSWLISGHKLREPTPTVAAIISENRYTLSSTNDLFVEDLLEINSTLYRIRRIFGDDIVLYSNVQGTVLVNDVFRKSPINSVYFVGENKSYRLVENRDFTVTNNSSKCQIELEDDAELNFIRPRIISASVDFTNGSRQVDSNGVNLLEFVRPRDFIKSDSITHTTYYEVLSISEDGLTLFIRTNYAGATITTSDLIIKSMEIIDDDSTISVDCYGYEDAGVWLRTASDAVKHMVTNDAGLTDINTTSFTESDSIGFYTLSYFTGQDKIKIRDAIDEINKSVFGSLYNNSTFQVSYSVLEPDKGDDLDRLETDDVFSFTVNSKVDLAKTCISRYRHNEANNQTGDSSFSTVDFDSEFVENLTGLEKIKEFDLYLYNEEDADLVNQRLAFIYSLSQSVVSVESDLRLSLKSLNDKVWINLDRMYKRFGQAAKQKIGIVTRTEVKGGSTDISFSDLGNIFNRVASIADDSTAAFSAADDREKMLAGFIVDNTVHLPDTSSDTESNTNLIG